MKKSTEMLNQIKTLLSIEVKLEELKLENGTVLTAEAFEKGKEIFIKTDDEEVALPKGEYSLEDGKVLVIEEDGVIADLKEEVKEEVKEEEEITSDLAEEEEEADVQDWAGMEKRIKNLEDAIADLKADKEDKMSEKEEEVEMSEEVKEEVKEGVKEELSAVKVDLSEASAKPIKHNPEAKTEKIEQKVYAQGKFQTTLSRVMNRINQINN